MKKIFLLILTGLLLHSSSWAQAANAQELAEKIARKITDTLSLTDSQYVQLLGKNLQLHQLKAQVWQLHENSDSLLQANLQRIENTRDSLYRPVFTSQQYLLYLQKKRMLVSSH